MRRLKSPDHEASSPCPPPVFMQLSLNLFMERRSLSALQKKNMRKRNKFNITAAVVTLHILVNSSIELVPGGIVVKRRTQV